MIEDEEKKILIELEQNLCRLSSDIYMLSSRAAYLSARSDDIRDKLHYLCYKMKISDEWEE